MFMYASAYSFAKKLKRELLIDDETAYSGKKKIYTYHLNIFDIKSNSAPINYKFLGLKGYLRRKTLKYFDRFNKNKNFYIEPKDINKKTVFNQNAMNANFTNPLYIEGHFETEKYFIEHAKDIKKEFTFKNISTFKNNKIFKDIKNSNSVSICVRQNRFSERKRAITNEDQINSKVFTGDQIKYINKAINIIKSKISDPKFFIWSNDHKNLNNHFPLREYTPVSTNDVGCDLFLMTQSKHFVVIPSSYNWWGAWLNENKNGIILRPSNNHFTNFSLNNKDFWPDTWTKI